MKTIFTIFAVTATAMTLNASSVAYAPQVKMNAAEVNNEVILNPPDGELTWLNRSCDGYVTKAFDATHGPILGSVVQMVEANDGYVYLSHMASEYPVDTWTKFTREGNTLVLEGVNIIYVEYDEYYDMDFGVYLAPMKKVVNENNIGTFVVTDDCRFVLNIGEDGSLTSADPEILLGVCVHTLNEELEGDDVWMWKGFGDCDIKMVPFNDEPLSLPEGLEVANWVMNDGYMNSYVQVAIEGDDFYLNGVDRSLPDAWIKGKIADGKVTFPSGQYLGADMEIYYYSYFCGADFSEEEDEDGKMIQVASYADSAIFAYDAENGQLTMERGYIINSTPKELYPLYFYDDVTVGIQHRNPEVAPAAPYGLEFFETDYGNSVWFMLPNVDEEGNILQVNNLYYEIYVNGELQYYDLIDEDYNVDNTARIPYLYNDWYDFWVDSDDPRDHTVYLYYDGVVKGIGVRSIYVNENGEDVYSKMEYWGDANGVEGVVGDKVPVSVKWYDLQGRPMNGKGTGVAIRVATYSDGSLSRSKVISAE